MAGHHCVAGQGRSAGRGVPAEVVQEACDHISTPDKWVQPANFNEPDQTVISGEASACEKVIEWITNSGKGTRFRALELNVSAPFHSMLMKPAEEKLAEAFVSFNFKTNTIPYVANIDAQKYESGTPAEIIKQNLLKQVCGSVEWCKSIQKLPSSSLCIEVGPGKILAGLLRKINRDIKVISLDNENGFQELEEALA